MATKNKPKKNLTKENLFKLIDQLAEIDVIMGGINQAIETPNNEWDVAQNLTEKLSSTVDLD